MNNQTPKNWQLKKLTELGDLNRGKSKHRPRDAAFLYGGPYPFIQTGDIKASNGRITSYTQTYSEAGLAQSRMWSKDTICITIAANIADLGKLTFPACFPDSVIGFLADKTKSDPDFILYSLQYLKRNIQSYATGSTQDNINLGTFENVLIPTPELPDQKKIASILSAFDDKIELNDKIAKTLEEMAQALFKEWFIHFKFPGHEKVEFVGSGLGRVPKEWKIGKIKDLIDIISGYPFSSRLYNIKEGVGVVTIKNVQDGEFITECDSFIKHENLPHDFSTKCYLKNGDIILSLTGNVGRVCFVYGGEYLLNQRVAKLVPSRPNDLAYCYFLFRQKPMQNYMINMAKGSAQPNLSPVEMANTKLIIPPDGILDSFSRAVGPIYTQLLSISNQKVSLAALRDLLLPKLMEGEIRV